MKNFSKALLFSYFITIICSIPFPAAGSQTEMPANDRREFYRQLAHHHAPILFQDTEVRGESQDEGNRASIDQPLQRRGDFITKFDFDGDWNGLNNWDNWAKHPPTKRRKDIMARAYLYYSVVETETHYFINYCAYHAHDREPRCSDVECHENDLEGGLHVVKKGAENGGMGTLLLTMYLAHDNWYTHLTSAGRAAGIKLGGKPPHETAEKANHSNAEFIYDTVWRGITPDGKLFTPSDPGKPEDANAPRGTVFRPTVWAEPWGHGMYGWPGPDAKSPYDRYRKPEYAWKNGFINGDGVIYFPGKAAGVPDYRNETDLVSYELIDFFEPNGLWDRREQIDRKMDGCGGGKHVDCIWGYFGTFRGERWGTDKANAPWRWDHMDDKLPPGMQSYDPLRLVEEFNNLSAVPASHLSRNYTNNLYLGLPEGTRPNRPKPIADAGSRVIVVKPNESFTLDGIRSHTADLDGRGYLLFRWDSPAEGFGEPILGENWIRKSLTREGTYPVRLTVNDGDHSATDEVRVIVTNKKLFFDDFQTDVPQSAWRFLGPGWQQGDGVLRANRPGAGLNAAIVADRIYPKDLVIETLMRLDMVYREAREPFGVGVAYQNLAGDRSALLFGFAGTRRIDARSDPARKHMTEVTFYNVNAQKRTRLDDSVLLYPEGFKLGLWYHVKLMVEGGSQLKGKIWPQGAKEPEWMYEVKLAQPKSGVGVPILTASISTSGAATYDYFLVTEK
jgi:hypothetical protein